MALELNIEELREMATEAQTERGKEWQTAEDLAYDHMVEILNDDQFKNRMLEEAQNGRSTVVFYKWSYVPDGDERYTFGGVRILDLVKRSNLKKRLNEYVGAKGFFINHRVVSDIGRPVGRGRGRGRGRGGAPRLDDSRPRKYELFIGGWRKKSTAPPPSSETDTE